MSKRRVRLKLIGGGRLELREDIPRTRAECPVSRPCGHIRCRHNLLMIDGVDREGRPRGDGRPQPSTIRPIWLEWPVPESCELDAIELAEAQEWNQHRMALALGLSKSGFKYLLVKARRKLLDQAPAFRKSLSLSDDDDGES